MTPDNATVDDFILARLPSTFGRLSHASPDLLKWERPIDRGLQRLRKSGKIYLDRSVKPALWRIME